MVVDSISVNVKIGGCDEAVAALDRVTEAANRARDALASLNGAGHGGISVAIVGDLVSIDIKPAAAPH